jgi:IS1 family transposase/transposase-like protein
MTCHNCRIEMVKAGYYGKQRVQRFKCRQCGKRLSEPPQRPFNADIRLAREKVAMILHCLAEGNSVRGTARLCDVEKRTVLNLLVTAGEQCERFMERTIQNMHVTDLELDECWTFVKMKEKRKGPNEVGNTEIGDQYVYIAQDRASRMVIAWHVGRRDQKNTNEFIEKVRTVTAANQRFDVSTDAFSPYSSAINVRLWDRANHSIVTKVYSKPEETRERYSPGDFVTVEKSIQRGNPDLEKAGTSHVERKNGSLRQWCKRLTRLTYAFSKRKSNLRAALALHFWFYNFARVHASLRITPAMETGIADHVWSISELLD